VYILKELCRYAAIRLSRECCSLCSLCLVEPGEHGTWSHECRRICRDPRHGFRLYLARHVWLSPRCYRLNIKPMSLCPEALWLPRTDTDWHILLCGSIVSRKLLLSALRSNSLCSFLRIATELLTPHSTYVAGGAIFFYIREFGFE